jgi:hypothetical protein
MFFNVFLAVCMYVSHVFLVVCMYVSDVFLAVCMYVFLCISSCVYVCFLMYF